MSLPFLFLMKMCDSNGGNSRLNRKTPPGKQRCIQHDLPDASIQSTNNASVEASWSQSIYLCCLQINALYSDVQGTLVYLFFTFFKSPFHQHWMGGHLNLLIDILLTSIYLNSLFQFRLPL